MQLTGPEILKRMKEANANNPNGKPDIIITPFDERCLGSNSYDLHLGDTLKVYKHTIPSGMKPAIEYKGEPYLHRMQDWFEEPMMHERFRGAVEIPRGVKMVPADYHYQEYLRNPDKYDIRNPKYLIDPTNPKHHETIDLKIPETGLILSPCIGYLGATIEYTETRNLFPYMDGKSSIGRNFMLVHHTAGRGDDGFCGQWTLEISVLNPTVVYPYMRIGQIYYEEFIGERKPYNINKSSHYNGQMGATPAVPVPVDTFLKGAKQRTK